MDILSHLHGFTLESAAAICDRRASCMHAQSIARIFWAYIPSFGCCPGYTLTYTGARARSYWVRRTDRQRVRQVRARWEQCIHVRGQDQPLVLALLFWPFFVKVCALECTRVRLVNASEITFGFPVFLVLVLQLVQQCLMACTTLLRGAAMSNGMHYAAVRLRGMDMYLFDKGTLETSAAPSMRKGE